MRPPICRSFRVINRRKRHGITIVEILIAITISLTVLLALAVAFREMSKEISNGRSVMELATKLRNASETIRNDLENATVTPRHWTDDDAQLGYIEVGEGPSRDKAIPIGNVYDMQGDIDDYLALTVRSEGKPFRGRFAGQIIESPVAEIVYWTQIRNTAGVQPFPNDTPIVNYGNAESLILYRRVLLVRPDLDVTAAFPGGDIESFYQGNDISVRIVGGRLTPNSLEDLTLFENRFAHTLPPSPAPGPGQAPIRFLAEMDRSVLAARVLVNENLGEDVLLTDLLGFDLRVYSQDAVVIEYAPPAANAYDNNQYAFGPADHGYLPLANSGNPDINFSPSGAFVDIGYVAGALDTQFEGPPISLNRYADKACWTNWTSHYEKDGFDQDEDGQADEATNGLDDDNLNGVDDTGEREILPPYPYPLRGLQATLRLLDVKTKQIRQSTLTHSFLPQ